jgi:Leucine-rich repeat (LRR) protein
MVLPLCVSVSLRLCVKRGHAHRGLAFLFVALAAITPASAADPLPDLHALNARLTTNPAGQVIAIDLANAWLSDPDLEKLAALPHLESINLAYTKITDEGLERLVPLKNVKNLDLYYAEFVTDLGIAHLKHWKNLERLNVRGTKVTSTLFEHVSKFQQLKFLDVGHSRVNDDLFELLGNLPRLEHLSFGGNKMSGVALPLLKSIPSLKSLSVSGQQRTDSGLWGVSVTDFSVVHIAALPNLEVLDLGETNITDRGIAELARLKNLHTLDLRGTRVTAKGLTSLAALPNLRHLKLWKAKAIDDTAAPALLNLKNLESLEVPETNLTFAGLTQLSTNQNQHLKHLHLGGLTLTDDQLASLRQALPNCHISFWTKPAIEYPDTGRRSGN